MEAAVFVSSNVNNIDYVEFQIAKVSWKYCNTILENRL